MKTKMLLGLSGLLVALALVLASCGGAGNAAGGGSQGMDQGSMGQKNGGGMAGMDGGGMGSPEMARRMLTDGDGDYSDRRFVDMMVPHHQGAIEMAEAALENSDREEILNLARDIVRTQNTEIEELKSIKKEEFGTSEIPMDMGDGGMQGMMMDPQSLGDEESFDKAFIDAMIPHHESAIAMANVALEGSENPRIRDLARNIVSAQEREIAQMKEWRKAWYPEG